MSTLKKIKNIEDLDINIELIHEAILKILYVTGGQKGKDISSSLKVVFTVIEEELVLLKKRELIVVAGASSVASGYQGMLFELTSKGRERCKEIMSVRSYSGALPVTLDHYTKVIKKKKIKTRSVTVENIKNIFKNMVLGKNYFSKLGPGINSGGPLLLFGNPGNGKTMVAEKIIEAFEDYIYIPYCLMIDGQFIKYFDEKVHKVLSYDTPDPRWVKIRRPFVVVGGELTLDMLDLTYKEEFKYYEAPLQLKANGGVLLIDDFGRQLVSPKELLNRWIYPLEKKVDYLTLVTGKKLEVPFLQMIVFSSNLNPKDLGDDAFLRRIKYKIEITDPTEEDFKKIFKVQCKEFEINYSEDGFNYMVKKYYRAKKRSFRGCHPRDILSHIVDYNIYNSKSMTLTKENIEFACDSYFSTFT
jgi:predicted ATPase with chaperone activity